MCSEKGVVRQCPNRCVNITKYTSQTWMEQPTAHLEHVEQPIAPRPPACTARDHTEQQEVKSSTRENGAVQRRSKHETYEAAASVTVTV